MEAQRPATPRRIRLTVALAPKPYKRIRVAGRVAYNDAVYERWRTQMAWLIRAAKRGAPAFTGPVEVGLRFRRKEVELTVSEALPRPKGLTGDLDNYAKAMLDALTESGLIADDRQVTSLWATMEADDAV